MVKLNTQPVQLKRGLNTVFFFFLGANEAFSISFSQVFLLTVDVKMAPVIGNRLKLNTINTVKIYYVRTSIKENVRCYPKRERFQL